MPLPTAATLFEKLPRALRRHRLMRAWMGVTGEDSLQLVRIRDGAFGYADMSDGFLRLIVIDGDFERDFFRVADSLLENGGTFVDAGANYGLLTFGLAFRFGARIQFHLFEPNQKLVDAIERTRALYPQMSIRVNQAAVGDADGIVAFAIDAKQSGASHVSEDAETTVRCLRLDRYLEAHGLGRVELLKLDVEGYELKALRGAERYLGNHAIQAIYFEYFEKWLQRVQPPGDLLRYLDGMNYETCLCRESDILAYGGATHTIRKGRPGHGLSLLPLAGKAPPRMTDLLAIPKENLAMAV